MPGPFRVLGFGHVGIRVRDVEGSRKFYEETLGFSTVWEYRRAEGDLTFIGNGNCVIELMQADGTRTDGPLDHLSVLVDDVEAAVARLEAQGVAFEMGVTPDPWLYPHGERFAILRGPDCERIQLEQILTAGQ